MGVRSLQKLKEKSEVGTISVAVVECVRGCQDFGTIWGIGEEDLSVINYEIGISLSFHCLTCLLSVKLVCGAGQWIDIAVAMDSMYDCWGWSLGQFGVCRERKAMKLRHWFNSSCPH